MDGTNKNLQERCDYLEKQLNEAKKQIDYYQKIAEETGRTRLKDIVELSKLIEEIRKTKLELEKSETKNNAILEALPDLVFILDKDGTYLDSKAGTYNDLYSTPDNFMGKKVFEVLPKELSEQSYNCINKTLSSGYLQSFEYQIKLQKGVQDFESRFVKLGNDKVLTIVRNISKRKKAEKELQFLSAITKKISDSIIVTDTKFKIIYINEATESLFGYSIKELVGKTPEMFNAEPISKVLKKNIYQTVSSGDVWCGTLLNRRKNGSRFYCEIKISSLYDNNGNIYAYIGIQRDITEKRKLQEQLIQSEKLSAVGHLASGIAHEFNNILAIIGGNVQLFISQANDNEELMEMLKIIINQTKRGADIVSNMTVFAKPKEPKKEICDISEVIEDILRFQKKIFKLENIKIIRKYTHKNNVNIDVGQMEQVFMNLVNNARHAVKPVGNGKIYIFIKDIEDNIEVCFTDTGIGMDEQTAKNIFNPFYTTKGARAKDGFGIPGTGLGLSVTHSIIQNHNGTINVESEEGKGTTFIIMLPSAKVIKDSSKDEKVKKINSIKSKDIKILIVDDEKSFTYILTKYFNQNGYNNVSVVNSGREAISLCNEQEFDVIFLDKLLPDMNGKEVFKNIKKLNKEVPIIYISGQVGLVREKLIENGAYDFLQKPFDVDELINILNKLLKKTK